MDKGEEAFVRRQRSWAGFGTVTLALCCVVTVHLELMASRKSDVAGMRREVRRTKGGDRDKEKEDEKRTQSGFELDTQSQQRAKQKNERDPKHPTEPTWNRGDKDRAVGQGKDVLNKAWRAQCIERERWRG